MQTIKKYLRLYGAFVKFSLISQMEYRANFLMAFLSEIIFVALKLVYMMVIYQVDFNINGFETDAMLLFSGTYILITGFYTGIMMINLNEIPDYVGTGHLDALMTKPVSLQFMVSFRYVDFGSAIPNITCGLGLIIIGWKNLKITLDIVHILGYIIFIISAILISYSIFFAIQSLSFWMVKTNSLNSVIENLWDYNNMPMVIYPTTIQKIGIFIIPLFVISNFPPLFVLDNLNYQYLIWGILCPFIFILLTKKLWDFACTKYTSASS